MTRVFAAAAATTALAAGLITLPAALKGPREVASIALPAPQHAGVAQKPKSFGDGIAFEPSAGRLPRGTDWVARGRGYSLFVGATGTRVALGHGHVLSTRITGASSQARGRGERKLAG